VRFIKTRGAGPAANYLANLINKHLNDGKRVVWFVSGGSAIQVATAASKAIEKPGRLTISLIDERFGLPGHQDSNWQQLIGSGFKINGAKSINILKGNKLEDETSQFDSSIAKLLNEASLKIALLGMGEDGHTAGILPHSSAVNSPNLVESYQGPDYQRITLTPKALKKIDTAIVYAMGKNKHTALEALEQDLTIDDMPAQIFKQIPDTSIYNDYKGEVI
jgi:6-phosphogluconolactonase/glucosamine-6-phosphate isomerase/deaminase